MKKLFIISLVAAELAMVGAALPQRFSPGQLIAPPRPVDAKWARAMARKVALAQREDQRKAGHRQALEACIGPNGPSMSPTRYEAKAKACENRFAGEPEPPTEPQPYYPPPPASPTPPASPPEGSVQEQAAVAEPAPGDAS